MTAIFWLSRDFRFADNSALTAAADHDLLVAVFFIDRQLREQGAASRWRVQRAVQAFAKEFSRRSDGRLLILDGEPEEHLPRLCKDLSATEIYQSDWPCAVMRKVQDGVIARLEGQAQLILHQGHLLLHPRQIRAAGGGAYRVFTPFLRALRRIGVERPLPEVSRIRVATGLPQGLDPESLNLAPDLHGGAPILEQYALPAGEKAALARLDTFLATCGTYPDLRDRPDRDATSGLSEHLAVGEISPRTIWAIAIASAHAQEAKADREAVQKFLSEVAWREFAWHLLIDFPAMATRPWRNEWKDFPWQGRGEDFDAWSQARTGVPLVDAGLREMRVTGRMHNRVRMLCASYLTKHLLTDWRLGEAFFADSLTDWDPASNAMNWQWSAGSGPDATPFFRIFNPERQAQLFDPDGAYRHRWLSAESHDAKAYFATLPSRWRVPRDYPDPVDADTLKGGRERALAAWSEFRAE
ncbi:deoxyribodipyrimidine photo-lyase [Paracoccus caeni]|uniref:Deoxyribodipyrimidine photo-lyase n=1 Tax=Paracoccus caeni TaxID=657651 RepID=A0A934SN89_9RHOB|nr:deoxyribodipyrimidine photo-lyase [Paracoccus caeni]MBK4217438.1 deoxyribodipyrimidine photo-lyase [Paracoccus caeni]